VQPNGISQCIANGFLIVAFMPASERLYGRGMPAIYFAAGLAGQTANHFWESGIGGSSTAIFGVMGSLLVCVIRNRQEFLLPFVFIASVGLAASIVMLLSADGHGVGLVVGGAVASLLPLARVAFRSKQTDTFAEPSSA
jgi:membrane associated rhomboid family serine protease